ncbi:hypothetical protein HLB35_11360 [Halomonas sp. TBZ9]|uniref:Uncharacterized protein n=1 Tax=Vreelandella azerica TaxID=2732867 RepID=A0A7Y3TXV0_9GAMM|nr:DUF6586 family protein [Halomonas azerica]NOG32207.1 hypothetical protein [Halomonas azerica]
MTPKSRTNQLFYHAQLMADTPAGDDEHAAARKMAMEESALALLELALESMLKELTEHARLDTHRWQLLLAADGPDVAELQRLRDVAADADSWLGWLIFQLERLHSDQGAGRRSVANPGMIALGSETEFADQLLQCIQSAKTEVAQLRETSQEW